VGDVERGHYWEEETFDEIIAVFALLIAIA
jgi:hypothetical protein